MQEVLTTEDILIDLSSTGSFENILFELTNIIEKEGLRGKDVKINFGSSSMTLNMISNMLSLLKSFDINTKLVFSTSLQTKLSALDAGLTVSGNIEDLKPREVSCAVDEPQAEDKLFDAMNKDIPDNAEIIKEQTLYIKQTLRSGQRIEHDGNIVIIGDCKAGSEIIASGDISIWGILNGIAHAGAKGNYNSAIRAFRINAIQLRIADLLARRPDSIEVEKTDKNSQFTPEEAKVADGEIVIYSLNG